MRAKHAIAFQLFVAVAVAFGLGALAFASRNYGGLAASVSLAMAAFAWTALALRSIRRSIERPLNTATSVLDALRRRDYAHRARVEEGTTGPVAALLVSVNEFAVHLAEEQAHAEKASALLEALVQRLDVALLAFDEHGVLSWWNPAAERIFRGHLGAGATAASLGVADWLEGPAPRAVTVPGNATAEWELRRGIFRRFGQRYQSVLLASTRRVQREQERIVGERLLRVIGHEVNNTLAPIHSIAGTCAKMLRDDGERAIDDVVEALETIEHRSGSLAGFIAEYARLARLPTPSPGPFALTASLRRLSVLDTRCPIKMIAQRDVMIVADGSLLEQAFLNLLRNAVDAAASNNGGVTVDCYVEGADAVVVIADEGQGIDNPDNLFVPLFSTKPGGSGIGLVLARNIVEAHRGELSLTNRVRAQGAVARVRLPLDAVSTAMVSAEADGRKP